MLIRHIALLSAASLCLTAAEATELRITLHNVMPKQGEVLVTLFDQAKGFPDQPSTTQPSQRLRPDSSTSTSSSVVSKRRLVFPMPIAAPVSR